MSKRFNVVQAKSSPNQEKTFWHRHGVAFEKEGKISIKLESLPIPNAEGDIWLKLFDADDKPATPAADAGYMAATPAADGQAPWGDQGAKPLDAVPPADGGLDDEIPF